MFAHSIVNQMNPAEPIIEQRPDGTIIANLGEFRQVVNPTTHDVTFEVRYNGQWYIENTESYATEIAAAAAGTYPLSTIS